MKTLVTALLLITLTGCGALSTQERERYDKWEESGTLVVEKKPIKAAWLGFLPGVGSFYVGNIALGVVDIFLWYPSILWDVPVSYHTARRRNYEATLLLQAEIGARNASTD